MYRVCSQHLVKSLRHSTRRRMSSQTHEWEKEKLQMQYKHEETMKRFEYEQKRFEYEQKRGLEHLGVSRDTANLLTVGGTTVLVVSSGSLVCIATAGGHKSECIAPSARGFQSE